MLSSLLPLVAVAFCLASPSDTVSVRFDPVIEAAVALSGASCAEELDDDVLDRFRTLSEHPLLLNRASRSRLLSCGLLSSYQVASFEDYRARNGDVMSFAELVSVNGFSREYVELLRPFVSLDTSLPPGHRDRHFVSQEVVSRGIWRMEAGESVTAGGGLRYNLECNDMWEFNCGLRGSTVFSPGERKGNGLAEGFSLAYMSPRGGRKLRLAKFIAGDYSLRFGQGLALWNGLSFSGLSSVSSFSRNPTGAVPYRSYSGSTVVFGKPVTYKPSSNTLRGLASEMSAGRFSLTTALACYGRKDWLAAVNASFYGRIHQESATAYFRTGADGQSSDAKVSFDGRVNLRGTDVFAEAAADLLSRRLAFLSGTRFKAGELLSFAAMVRYYPSTFSAGLSGAVRSSGKCSDEHGASLALRLKAGGYVGYQPSHLLDACIDGACFPSKDHLQLKFMSAYTWTPAEKWQLVCRFQYRHRNYDVKDRSELRTDLKWKASAWAATARLHLLHGEDFACLGYAEFAYIASRFNAYAKAGLFHTKGWNDRIYAYERDAPGGFSAPAFYGDGFWTSAYLTADIITCMRAYARFSLVSARERPLHMEATLQLRFRF